MVRMMIFKGISKPQDRKTSSFCAPLARSHHIVMYICIVSPPIAQRTSHLPKEQKFYLIVERTLWLHEEQNRWSFFGNWTATLRCGRCWFIVYCVFAVYRLLIRVQCGVRELIFVDSGSSASSELFAKNLKKTRKAHPQHQAINSGKGHW